MKRMLALAVAGALLSACASIPSTGPIVQGPRVDVLRNDGYVRVLARPPVAGMSPEAVVRGFLVASASIPDGDDTARAYLTSAASRAWNAQSSITVYDAAALTVTVEGDDRVRIAAPKIGTIDGRNRYITANAGAQFEDVLQLRQVDGEWRIDSAPKALYLGEGDVRRSYRPYPVYFFDPAFTALVPEFVLLPIGSGGPATQLMRSLLAGPSSEFDSALVSAIPRGTTLGFRTVSISGTTASVPLDRVALAVPADRREALLAQIVWTLSTLPQVVLVRVTVDGEVLTTGAGTGSYTAADFTKVDPEDAADVANLVFVQGDQAFELRDSQRRQIPSAAPASALALSRSGGLAAFVTQDRKIVFVTQNGSSPRPIAVGRDLARPQILADGRLWFVDREAQGGLRAWDPEAGVQRVTTGLADGARILDYAIAPDRSRIAVVVNNGVTTTLRIGVISRTQSGYRIVGLARVEQKLSAVSTVTWENMQELVVIGSIGAVAVQPIRLSLPTGELTLLGGPANAVTITASIGQPIIVGDEAGQLWEYRDGRWNASELGSAPNYVL